MARKEGDLNPNRRTKVRGESSGRPGASVNMDELRELIALLRENGLAEFELERAGFRVRLRREGVIAAPVQYAETPAAPVVAAPRPAQVSPQTTTPAPPVHTR